MVSTDMTSFSQVTCVCCVENRGQWAKGGAGRRTKMLWSEPGRSGCCLHQGYNWEGVPSGWILDGI